MEKPTKQVIVMRKDLGMRKGKMIAQGAHASTKFLSLRIQKAPRISKGVYAMRLTPQEEAWIEGSFKKICVAVSSEEELFEIHAKAKQAGLQLID